MQIAALRPTRIQALVIPIATLLFGAATPLLAQVNEGFNAQNFRPPIDPHGFVVVNGARSLRAGELFVGAYVDTSEDPLDLRDIREGVIERMTFAHAVAAVGVLDVGESGGLSLGVVVPYAVRMEGFGRDPGTDTPVTAVPPAVDLPDGRLADIRAEAKLGLSDPRETVGLALRAYGTLPTGEDKFFLSNDEHFGAGGALVLEKELRGFRIGVEAGYEWISGRTIISTVPFVEEDEEGEERLRLLTIDDKVHLRGGLAKQIFVRGLWLVAEAHHWVRAADPYGTSRESPLEIGAALRFDRRALILLGVSTGLTDGVGAPSVRGFASVGYRF